MPRTFFFLFALLFLMGTFFLTAVNSAFRRFHKRGSKKQLNAVGKLFFYRYLHKFFFPHQEYEGLFFATLCALNITRFLYVVSAVLSLTAFFNSWTYFALDLGGFLLVGFLVGDYLPRVLGTRMPAETIRFCAPGASLFLLFSFPITFIFLKILHPLSRPVSFDHLYEPSSQVKQELIELIQETNLSSTLDNHERKLIASVLTFREHIAREIMVPRVNVFSLPASTSIKEAGRQLEAEGYSRIPVYKNTVDNIVGVLMYKDILSKYMEYEQKNNDAKILEAPIESIIKGVLFTPETKKISHLLQDFRKKQVHLAIVVDEYGGTEGIVTIEDILEQIVGQIADEYDEEKELFVAQADGAWIVDPRMSILDAEEQLGIKIPQEGDYDTIGGYIYQCAGTIPPKGFSIQRDEFVMEILRSSDKGVEKVRIRPTPMQEDQEGSANPL